MRKILLLAASSAVLLAACGDESTTTVNETTGLEVIAKGEKLSKCTDKNEGAMVYVTDSSAVYYCADGSWAVLNGEDGKDGQDGKDGEDGKDGQNGEDGQDGAKGDQGDSGDDGTSCTAMSIAEGVEVSCGGEVIDTLTNGVDGQDGTDGEDGAKGDKGDSGDDGTSCTAKSIAEGIEVSCGGEVIDTLTNGVDGQDGIDGEDGAKGDKGDKGDSGNDGTSCTVGDTSDVLSGKTGYKLVCGEEVKGVVWNGADGQNGTDGDDCSIVDNGDGTVSVSCGENTSTLYKAMCGAIAYDPSAKFCVDATLYDLCAGKSYDPSTQYCLTLKNEEGEDSPRIEALLTDSRDNQVYKTVTIGTQTWMAENLNYAYNKPTSSEDSSSFCYNNSAESCSKYGRLYLWSAAMDSAAVFSTDGNGCGRGVTCSADDTVRGVCPEGWHLPSNTELFTLVTAVGGTSTAGTVLKSTSGWYDDGNGEDSYGFSVLPVGSRDNDGTFYNAGRYAHFWSSTQIGSFAGVYSWYFRYNYANVENDDRSMVAAYSVRCVKDSN